jgi:ABC-2 type transport system permease protein
MKNLLFLLHREFILFWSNKLFVAAFLVMPVVIATVFGTVYRKGKTDHLRIVIVDKDQTPASNTLRDMLENDVTLDVVETRYESVDLERTLLERKAVAIIVIPYRFEADLLSRRDPEVDCYLNMGALMTANLTGSAVTLVTATMNAGMLTSAAERKGVPVPLAAEQYEAFKSNVFQLYNRSGNYLYFLWPGLIFSTLHQLLLLALAVGFSREMEAGTFRSVLLRYSRSPAVLIFVKVLPYMILSLPTIAAYFILSFYFQVPLPAHPLALFCGQLLFVLAACLLASCYSVIYPLPLKASQLLMSIASPAFTLSGFTWPSGQAPAALVAFGKIIPLTPYLKLLRMTLLQQATWTDILPEIRHLAILAAVYFSIIFLLLKIKIRRAAGKEVAV